jgi:uncharacterized protein (DUF111 family)
MRTTLAIDDAVLELVRKVAVRRQQSLGEAVTYLLRQALEPKSPPVGSGGLPVMPVQPGAGQADLKIVNALRDELA